MWSVARLASSLSLLGAARLGSSVSVFDVVQLGKFVKRVHNQHIAERMSHAMERLAAAQRRGGSEASVSPMNRWRASPAACRFALAIRATLSGKVFDLFLGGGPHLGKPQLFEQ